MIKPLEKVIVLNPAGCGDPSCMSCYPIIQLAARVNEIRIVEIDAEGNLIMPEEVPAPTYEGPEGAQ